MLLQLRVFGFGLFADGDVRVSVFPEGQKILICGFRLAAVCFERVSASDLYMSQSAYDIVFPRVRDDRESSGIQRRLRAPGGQRGKPRLAHKRNIKRPALVHRAEPT